MSRRTQGNPVRPGRAPWQARAVIDDASVARHVRTGWRLPVTSVRYLAIGLDADARAYEARTGTGEPFFVKVRAAPAGPAAVLVPRYLRRCGLTPVVAPIDTAAGEPWLSVDGHQLLVYPFVAGTSAWRTGLTDEQFPPYGEFLADLHRTELPPDLAAQVAGETFDPPSLARMQHTARRLGEATAASPSQRELLELWRGNERRVADLAARTAALRELARARQAPHVLCHTDIHTGNVLVDAAGALSIVDWDAPLLAPRERDLMFVLGGPWSDRPVTALQERLFWQGYGGYEVDRTVLAYYRCERVLDDIEQFARRILADDVDEAERREELHWLRLNLAPAKLG
jgi:spectinomycin phosphotransferase